jgi:hypothetical protein
MLDGRGCFSESFWYYGLASRCSEAELIYFSHQENSWGGLAGGKERYEPDGVRLEG